MTEQNRKRNARTEARCGDEALRAADALLGPGFARAAVASAYYAAFHYARAVLLTEGLEPKTHRGVIAIIGERFTGPGRLAPAVSPELARLQTRRALADYETAVDIPLAEAADDVAAAHQFVAEAVRFMREGGWVE
jgi:uncharacterized protein (UPF0332 family)